MLVIPFRKHSSYIDPFKNSFVNIFDIRSVEEILIKNRSSKSKAKNRNSQLEVSNKKKLFWKLCQNSHKKPSAMVSYFNYVEAMSVHLK